MSQQFTSGRFRSFLDSGAMNVGGRLYTYASGTTTHKDAFTDATLTVPCTYTADSSGHLYITLDARGEAQVWLGAGTYTMIDATPTGVVLDSTDGILAADLNAEAALAAFVASLLSYLGASLVGFAQPDVGASPRTVESKLQELPASTDYPAWGAQCYAVGVGNFGAVGFAGSGNVVVGYNNLQANTTGFANKVFGNNCLQANTTGEFNYAFGDQVLQTCTTGSNNNGFGEFTLGFLTTGSSNSSFGDDNLRYMTTGSFNVSAGSQAGYNNLTGTWNTLIGTYAGRGAANPPDAGPGTGPSPTFCTAIGGQALYTATGTQNVGVGYNAGYATTGSQNSYLGTMAGYSITSGTFNVFVGYNAGNNASQAVAVQNSIAIGDNAYTTGSNGIAIGSAAVAGANEIVLGNTSNTVLRVATDNTINLGSASKRMATLFAGTGTINTSDGNEKQQFTLMTAEEKAVALVIKGKLGKFRFISDVASKGAAARWHFGAIAQDVAAAFAAQGLDATQYAMFCSDTWTNDDGSAQTRLGLRYDELLAFIVAAL